MKLARASQRPRARPGRRVYVLPGIMGSQLGFVRGGQRPNDILWLDPIDINFGRLTELKLPGNPEIVSLGAMSYTYLKLTLSLRKAGFDAVLLDYDWRHDLATLGKLLAERIAADGHEQVALLGHSMGGLVARAALTHAAGGQVSQLVMLGTPNHGSVGAVQALRGTYSVVRKLAMLDLEHDAEFLASEVFSSFPGVHELLPSGGRAGNLDLFEPGDVARAGSGTGCDPVARRRRAQRQARARGCALPRRGRLQSHHGHARRTARRMISNTPTACAATAPCRSNWRGSMVRVTATWIATTATCRCPIASSRAPSTC